MHVTQYNRPEFADGFYQSNPVSYQMRTGDPTKDRGKYRFRFKCKVVDERDGSTHEVNRQEGGFLTKNEALHRMMEVCVSLEKGTYRIFRPKMSEAMLFYLWYMIDEKGISYNTFCSYRNVISKIEAYYGKRYIDSINVSDVEFMLNNIGTSSSIRTMICSFLGGFFKFAEQKQFIAFNYYPAAKVRMIGDTSRQKSPDCPGYTAEEINQLLVTAKENYPEYMYYLYLLTSTLGLRVSEVIGLKFSDIDFKNGRIHIRRQIGRTITGSHALVEKKLKTKNSDRILPIHEVVQAELFSLLNRRLENDQDALDGYILCREDGTHFHRSSFNENHRMIIETAGLRYLSVHKLRHSYAESLFSEKDLTPKDIQTAMGHSSFQTTKQHYIYNKDLPYTDLSTQISEIWDMVKPQKESLISDATMLRPL